MVNFISRFVMSVSGFVATVVLTRTLGQEQYGTYVVALSILAWVAMTGKLGLPRAIQKRVSENTTGNFVLSGAIVQFGLYVIIVVALLLCRPYLNEFIGIDATWFLVAMLGSQLALSFVQKVLDGQHLVHISSLLSPVEWTCRSLVQVLLVLSGFQIVGAFVGYVIGALVAAALGTYFMTIPRTRPTRREFVRLKSYAQFSWLSSIKNRTFMSMDTIILAVFVSNSLIAVYEVAWNLASLFAIFGVSISQTLFPEISKISSEEGSRGEIAGLLRVSLAYSGLFIIPGLVGSALVGDVILTIYGPGFETGYYILLVLTFARLLYGYMRQFLNTIDAIDRPDLTFAVNAVFVVTNLVLNVVLTWQFGWYGAATATTFSSGLGLVLGYYYATQVVDVTVPVAEISKQCFAAVVMAAVVLLGRLVIGNSLPIVIGLVGLGATVYFLVLLGLSEEFRTTVRDNLPFALPSLVSE
ncbi:polysaccharide biosynthesis C-terminal domain-containing protein [Natrialba sp. PRR66]|uniref:lipopolysaccharide biosynthesis protein n=1 Tax=Natrialba sp. PRR66 TaxID=3098146 RepID=UPI002B1DDC8C|nr:polysaccharide biosynthesis C-terminal domain-containing protein [Natrialba sp. PRR66]